jgi:hypothetical protein
MIFDQKRFSNLEEIRTWEPVAPGIVLELSLLCQAVWLRELCLFLILILNNSRLACKQTEGHTIWIEKLKM